MSSNSFLEELHEPPRWLSAVLLIKALLSVIRAKLKRLQKADSNPSFAAKENIYWIQLKADH